MYKTFLNILCYPPIYFVCLISKLFLFFRIETDEVKREMNWDLIDKIESRVGPKIIRIPSVSNIVVLDGEDMTLLHVSLAHPIDIFPQNAPLNIDETAVDQMLAELAEKEIRKIDSLRAKEENLVEMKEDKVEIKEEIVKIESEEVEVSEYLIEETMISEEKIEEDSLSSFSVPHLYELALWQLASSPTVLDKPFEELNKSVRSEDSFSSGSSISISMSNLSSIFHIKRTISKYRHSLLNLPSYFEHKGIP